MGNLGPIFAGKKRSRIGSSGSAGSTGLGSGVAAYGLEHRLGGGSWQEWTSGGAGYTATSFDLAPKGAHTFRIWALDQVGRRGYSAAQTVVADRTPPGLTLAEHTPYAYVDGTALFYGLGTGAFTVTAALNDTLAGLAQVAFPDTTSPGGTYPQGGAAEVTASHVYTFSAASTLSAAPVVAVSDRAENESTAHFRVVRDAAAPTVGVAATVQDDDLQVTWSGTDSGSGLGSCTLEGQEDGGAWQQLSTACAGSLTTGAPGHLYTFRFTATDNTGNSATVETQAGVPLVTKYYYHGGRRVAQRRDGVVYYLHGDHLGSVSLATDAAGGFHSRQLFRPYGDTRYQAGTLPTDFGFAGQREDGNTGLVFMHARYYDARLGRFVSADTVVPGAGNPQALNRYSYAAGNPLRYIDPSGHVAWIPIFAAVGAIVTTATYVATTDEFDLGECALAAGAGALGGALIGTGVGAGAGIAIIAAGAGAGTIVSAESYMVSNVFTGESFDNTDFVITTGFGMAEGAAAAIPGVGPLGSTAISAVAASGQSVVTNIAHDESIDWQKAGTEAAWGGLAGLAGEAITGGFAPSPSGIPLEEGVKVIRWIPPDSISHQIITQVQMEAAQEAARTTVRDTVYSILTNEAADYLLE